ncbi:MAG TPA: YqaE/Pmp3 family membrane protein [Chitinophagaceae bacterium]|nr:YqaE/Pmp3 family membrane protein [Chitinophagaceae bacterium]
MKKFLFLVALLAFSIIELNATAIIVPPVQKTLYEVNTKFSIPIDKVPTVDQFLKLTPKQIEKITGKKLSFKQVVELKIVQKKLKHEMAEPSAGQKYNKVLWILLAIFIPINWILMGVSDDWKGNNWWVNLVLYALCYVPGLIHSLVHMKEYTE